MLLPLFGQWQFSLYGHGFPVCLCLELEAWFKLANPDYFGVVLGRDVGFSRAECFCLLLLKMQTIWFPKMVVFEGECCQVK